MDNLKPCPFCGGEAEYYSFVSCDPRMVERRPACQVYCKDCKIRTDEFIAEDSTFAYKDQATEAWNRRIENEGVTEDGK